MNKNELTSSQINQNVSSTIKFYRLKYGLSLTSLAHMINISQQQMSRYELGTSQLNVVYLYRLARIFDIDVHTFYTDHTVSQGIHCTIKTEELLVELIKKLSIEKQKCLLGLIS